MSIAHEFDYAKPARLKEALALLARPAPRGAVVLAGGTSRLRALQEEAEENEGEREDPGNTHGTSEGRRRSGAPPA